MDIESIGSETAVLLHHANLLNNIADFYTLQKEAILPLDRMAEKSAQNIITSVEKSKEQPFEKVLYAIGIRHVGETVAKKLVKHFQNIDRLMLATMEELVAVPDVGEKIALSIIEYFKEEQHQNLIQRLRDYGLNFEIGEEAKPLSDSLEGKTFLFTGSLTKFTRNEAQKMVEDHGGKNISAVSKNLNFLVAGDKAGSKLKKAEEIGTVVVLTEDEFLTMIKS